MQNIAQVNINGDIHHLFDQADLLLLIRDYMGDQVATLVAGELKEANEDKADALFTADIAFKDLEARTDSLQCALEEVQELNRQVFALLEAKRLNRDKLVYLLRDMREIVANVL